MALDRPWHRPTRLVLVPLLGATLLAAAAIAVILTPVDFGAWSVAWWGLGVLFFLAAWVPFVRFLFFARLWGRHTTFLALEGHAFAKGRRPEPPYTPSAPRRFFGWRYDTGTLPSCRVWTFRRPTGDVVRMRVLLGSPSAENEPPVENAKGRVRRWVERHDRSAGNG